MSFFAKPVKKNSRQSMIDFLAGHYRYDTMNSCNRSTSYANCIKIHRLGLTSEQEQAAYEAMEADYWDSIDNPIHEFTSKMGGSYTIGTNGRSSGYLVLYHSQYETTGYKSFCRSCGQRNYKEVLSLVPGSIDELIAKEVAGNNGCWHAEVYLGQSAIAAIDLPDSEKLALINRFKKVTKDASVSNRCGRCGAEGERGRINYASPPRQLQCFPGKEIDMHADFSEWTLDQLKSRVDLVLEFDRACDEIRENFIELIADTEVVEQVVMIPKTVKVRRPRA